jgi:hypothetical protein
VESINGRQVRIGINEAIDVAKMGALVAREGASGVEQAGQIRTGKARLNRFGAGPAWYWDRRGACAVVPPGERLGDCPVLLRGYFIMQQTARRPPSPAKPRISILHSPCAAASVCSPSAFSPAPVSTCICPIGMAVHSDTHLPATPSACPLGANGIRRPGFPPPLIPPIKTILPQIETLPSGMEPGCPLSGPA